MRRSTQLNVTLTEDLRTRLDDAAKAEHRTVAAHVRYLIDKHTPPIAEP